MIMKMKKFIFLLLMGLFLFLCGCVVLTITEELENPFVITMTWNGETLIPDQETGELPEQILDGDGAVVRARIADEDGKIVIPEIYEWYLKGELIQEGTEELYLDSTLEVGIYWLDLIVGKGEILSSEQLDFVVVQ
jgi:hypothetical protein